jgi:hypothetical protein
MAGKYWTARDDGAPWRCTECGQNKPAKETIVFQHTITGELVGICLECVDPRWLGTASCLGKFWFIAERK